MVSWPMLAAICCAVLTPIACNASICCVTRIVPSSEAICEPSLPARMIHIIVGENS